MTLLLHFGHMCQDEVSAEEAAKSSKSEAKADAAEDKKDASKAAASRLFSCAAAFTDVTTGAQSTVRNSTTTMVTLLVVALLMLFALHSTWVTSVAYSSPSVVLASQVDTLDRGYCA